MEGIDYSARPASLAAFIADMDAKGLSFVGRYLSYRTNTGKTPQPDEIAALRAAGKKLYWYFEETEGRPLEGRAAGVADATEAQARKAALGLPASTEVYFCVDTDTTGAKVKAYFEGIRSVMPLEQVDVYGPRVVGEYLLDRGLVHRFNQWMVGSTNNWSPRAALQQYAVRYYVGGVDCDRERATADDFGFTRWEGEMVKADTVRALALSLVGEQYSYGSEPFYDIGWEPATDPEQTDCSGLIYGVFRKAGVLLGGHPMTAADRLTADSYWRMSVKLTQPERIGDTGYLLRDGRAYHMFLFVGTNQVVEAGDGTGHVGLRTVAQENARGAKWGRLPTDLVDATPVDTPVGYGSHSQAVKHAQDRLNAHLGICIAPTALDFGPQTLAASKRFCRLKGLAVTDGYIGPSVWAELNRTPVFPELRQKAANRYVELLKYRLHRQGHGRLLSETNDSFGLLTDAAVRIYQRAKGLRADGVCGDKTWAALLR